MRTLLSPGGVAKAAAAGILDENKDMIMFLLNWQGVEIPITEEAVEVIVHHFDNEVVTLLLGRRGADVLITGQAMKTIVARFDKDMITFLLDLRGSDMVITATMVARLAEKEHNSKDVMMLLLCWNRAHIPVAEKAIAEIARYFDKEVVTLVLSRPEAAVLNIEEVVKAAIANVVDGKNVMELLLDQPGTDVLITEEVVKAAIDSTNSKDVMKALFDWREEEVVRAVFRTEGMERRIERFGKRLFRVRFHDGYTYHRMSERVSESFNLLL